MLIVIILGVSQNQLNFMNININLLYLFLGACFVPIVVFLSAVNFLLHVEP